MDSREEAKRHAVTFAICAFCSIVVWTLFHSMYTSLAQAAAAVGYVDGSSPLVAVGAGRALLALSRQRR